MLRAISSGKRALRWMASGISRGTDGMELVVRTIELAGDSMGFDNGQPLVATVVAEDIHVEVKRQVFIGVLWCLDTALASITDFCSTKCYSLDWCNDNGGAARAECAAQNEPTI